MHDDFCGKDWADHHGAVSDSLDALFAQVRIAFERLAARTYDAPWRRNENIRAEGTSCGDTGLNREAAQARH